MFLLKFLIHFPFVSFLSISILSLQGEVTPIDSVQTPATGVNKWVKQSKLKNWKVKRSKAHRKLDKVKGQAQLKANLIQNLIKARYHTL